MKKTMMGLALAIAAISTAGAATIYQRGTESGSTSIAVASVHNHVDFYVKGWADTHLDSNGAREGSKVYDFTVMYGSGGQPEAETWGFGILKNGNVSIDNGSIIVVRRDADDKNAEINKLYVRSTFDPAWYERLEGDNTTTVEEFVGKQKLTRSSPVVSYNSSKTKTLAPGNYELVAQAYYYSK